jgi:hypothetical protein
MSRLKQFLPFAIPKKDLRIGSYYAGTCRNANIARWDGDVFRHWREKFNDVFVEEIKHPEDEKAFDVFVPMVRLNDRDLQLLPPPPSKDAL